MEVLRRLVPRSVFKTVGLYGNHAAGGFDSHALPPFFLDVSNVPLHLKQFLYKPEAQASVFVRVASQAKTRLQDRAHGQCNTSTTRKRVVIIRCGSN